MKKSTKNIIASSLTVLLGFALKTAYVTINNTPDIRDQSNYLGFATIIIFPLICTIIALSLEPKGVKK